MLKFYQIKSGPIIGKSKWKQIRFYEFLYKLTTYTKYIAFSEAHQLEIPNQ